MTWSLCIAPMSWIKFRIPRPDNSWKFAVLVASQEAGHLYQKGTSSSFLPLVWSAAQRLFHILVRKRCSTTHPRSKLQLTAQVPTSSRIQSTDHPDPFGPFGNFAKRVSRSSIMALWLEIWELKFHHVVLLALSIFMGLICIWLINCTLLISNTSCIFVVVFFFCGLCVWTVQLWKQFLGSLQVANVISSRSSVSFRSQKMSFVSISSRPSSLRFKICCAVGIRFLLCQWRGCGNSKCLLPCFHDIYIFYRTSVLL